MSDIAVIPLTMLKFILSSFLTLLAFVADAQVQLALDQQIDIPVIQDGQTLKHAWTGGLNYIQVNQIDLNQDGRKDVLLFDRSGNRLIPMIDLASNGTPDYEYAPQYVDSFPKVRDWIQLVDYNCDGKEDIFMKVTSGVGVYENVSGPGQLRFQWALGNRQFLESDYGTGGMSNISVISSDIPAIVDMNNDGAVDIVTFALLGTNILLHENTQPCGLDYFMRTDCWGGILENSLSNSVYIDTCDGSAKRELILKDSKVMHAGSTICALDLDGNGNKDLLLGDVSFNNLVAVYNSGSPDVANITSQDTQFPSYDVPADVYVFPSAYYKDLDQDGKRDLFVSANISPSENANSVWFYENKGTDSSPNFELKKKNFLQEDMIELGESAIPVLFDIDGDGLQDLFVSSGGKFIAPGIYNTGLHYYKNTGSPTAPSFELMDTNFADLNSLQIGRYVHPAFGDLDGDGLADMIVGTKDGTLHYLKQFSSGSFSVAEADLDNIDVGQRAAPYLFDIDDDGALDLLIGEQSGNVNYYRQLSAGPNLNFQLETETFGGIQLLSQVFGGNSGFSAPVVQTVNNKPQLFVGSFDRGIVQYDSLENAAANSSEILGQFGTGTLSSSSINQTPFGTNKRVGRNQYLIKASELYAEGMTAGWISRIHFEIATSNNPIVYDDLYIRLKMTSSDSLVDFESGMTDVYNNTFVPFAVTQGWNSIVLHQNFEWDGEKNIIVEVCFSKNAPNPSIGVVGIQTSFTSNAFGDVDNNNTNSANGCTLPLLGRSNWRPNMRFTLIPGLQIERINTVNGHHLIPAMADLNGDSIPDMIIGNEAGGLEFFEGRIEIVPNIGLPNWEALSQNKNQLLLFPNPSADGFVKADMSNFKGRTDYKLFDLRGQLLQNGEWKEEGMRFPLPSGVYLLQLEDHSHRAIGRWIIQP